MHAIAERLLSIKSTLPEGVQLVAISKFHPQEAIEAALSSGHRCYGESRVQELTAKEAALPKEIEWHFIGHLQGNKVKYIAPFISLIHAVDSVSLLREINKQGAKCQRRVPCLLQLHVAQEETKFGFSPEELTAYMDSEAWRALDFVSLRGIMCMASNTDDTARVRADFRTANRIFETIKSRHFPDDPLFATKSWGMSGDYRIAIEEGSNMVRIGTAIFGEREY